MKVEIDQQTYNKLQDARNLYDENMALTIFVHKMFNAKLKHTGKLTGVLNYQQITEKFDISITFPNDYEFKKCQEIVNKNGPFYTWFLLQI